ncbi:MAG TPA: CsiV family protein [Coxiellaceae bacterium]|nr:MAG: hypothetical protein A3E81_07240 [Gammaproteobacteria bacterium RIFCSPHIGHO2_12_FULL_36_30]HLB57132.1 CsiV family protein [Coxiellaceae bacterium]
MKNYIAKIAGIALCVLMYCSISTALTSPARTYNVQVLIFSHITPATIALQRWPVITENLPAQTAVTTSSPATALQSEKNALLRDPNYKILVDESWIESWSGDQSTVNIPVVSSNGKLNGAIAITLGHYFDVNANLLLTEPTNLLQKLDTNNYFSKWDQSNFTFQLLQHRRMRSDELNYFEHPVFGMLIKILPVNTASQIDQS